MPAKGWFSPSSTDESDDDEMKTKKKQIKVKIAKKAGLINF